MPLRIAFIGAGSIGFTRTLVKDLLTVPELQDTVFALHDIDADNLGRVEQVLKKEIDANRLPATLVTSTDRRRTLEGADYVVNCTRIGGLDAFATDVEIPLKYGIDQCVGDTLCPGGIMYGQRNIPQILAFHRDAKEVGNVSRPGGMLMLNYANPMAMNTWAALDAFDRGEAVPTVGLCHGVEGGWKQIAEALAHLHGDDAAFEGNDDIKFGMEKVHRKLVEIVCAGINHQTWFIDIRYKGRPVGGQELLEAFESVAHLKDTERVRIDVLRRFGFYSTESNGHLSEYLPWYRKRPEEINRWISTNSWINGETGGYLRVCTEGQNWFKTDFPQWLKKAGTPLNTWGRSNEHGSYIIEARETGRPYRGHFNLRNGGTITNLPDDCIVEAPGYVDRMGFHMMSNIVLPQACAATCQASVNVQRMAKDAAVSGDVKLLKLAMLHDPLAGAVCNPEEIWQMADEMLEAQRKWLPNYAAQDIDAAAIRLAEHEKAGTRVALRSWKGAARLKVKSVEELRETRDTTVMAADKGTKRQAATAK